VSAAGKGDAAPSLYLVGFMGVGKSSTGRLAARRLGLRFIDSDQAIEAAQGRSIASIFETEGEAAFREMERAFVESGHPDRGCVVACGGGLVAAPGMAERLREKGIPICLLASPETILKRTSGNRARPLLDAPNPLARIRELLARREPSYQRAGTQILTDGRSTIDVANHVCRVYRREAARWKEAQG